MFSGQVNILHMIAGAEQARGLTVIIDVLRAVSYECYLFDMGAKEIRPVGSVEDAWLFRQRYPDWLLMGERAGKKCEGFDYGNSPSSVDRDKINGKCMIHTTSAGTQGIIHATHADGMLLGSLVNAEATAQYINRLNPAEVSLVCMGNQGVSIAKEDELCALYIKSLLEEQPLEDIDRRIAKLRYDGGEHFFDPNNQEVFPEPDFWLCMKYNRFGFAIEIHKDDLGYYSKKVMI